MDIQSVNRLIEKFASLPGVGKKTAQRYAFAIINADRQSAMDFASAIVEVKDKVKFCSICGNYTEGDTCDICASRDHSVICVVKDAKDILSMERVRDYRGVYHVLHGTLDPLCGVGPNDLNITSLISRLDGVKEVIVATNPDPSGEATAQYLSRLIKPLGIKVTRLGSGIPANSDIEYTDEVTLLRAIESRREI